MAATQDTLSRPLLKMGRFFLGDSALPVVESVQDIYRLARDLKARSIRPQEGEEALLRHLTWCMLQIQEDKEEDELHSALAHLAGLVLGIIEDDDFTIPAGCSAGSRTALEGLAIQFGREHEQRSMTLGVAIGVHGLAVASANDLADFIQGLAPEARTDELIRCINQLIIHLRQGEGIFANHSDPARKEAHRQRLAQAYTRTNYLLARLLGTPPAQDHPVERKYVIRREQRRIELDALGAKVLQETEQTAQTKQWLSWTEEDLGEKLTDANKAELAARLREAVHQDTEDDGDDWLSDMD
jgi:hypothetical protein